MTASHRFTLRLTPEENAALNQSAARHGVKRSRLVRRFIRELIRQRPDYFESDQNNLRSLNRELSAIGRNLNQIARKLNSQGAFSSAELNEALIDTKAGVTAVRKFIGGEVAAATRRGVSIMKEPEL